MTVVTAPEGAPVAPFKDGYTYNLKNSRSVRADPVFGTGVKSVRFKLDGKLIQTENVNPYSAAGNAYLYGPTIRWTPAVGSHTLVAIPYSAFDGGGTAGAPISVSFNVIDTR